MRKGLLPALILTAFVFSAPAHARLVTIELSGLLTCTSLCQTPPPLEPSPWAYTADFTVDTDLAPTSQPSQYSTTYDILSTLTLSVAGYAFTWDQFQLSLSDPSQGFGTPEQTLLIRAPDLILGVVARSAALSSLTLEALTSEPLDAFTSPITEMLVRPQGAAFPDWELGGHTSGVHVVPEPQPLGIFIAALVAIGIVFRRDALFSRHLIEDRDARFRHLPAVTRIFWPGKGPC